MTESSSAKVSRRRRLGSAVAVALIPAVGGLAWMAVVRVSHSSEPGRPIFVPAKPAPAAATAEASGEATDGEILPGHSAHGETFDEGPRRAAVLMGSTGAVHWAVSTKDPSAQAFFDQGIGQLHGFWFLEAERSFRQAASIDPSLAMAYWGMAMANVKNPDRARGFIERAVEEKKKNAGVTPLESSWIDLLSGLYAGEGKPSAEAKKKLTAGLASMRSEFPGDLELKAFSAYFAFEFKAKDQYDAMQKLLDEVFAQQPMHPAQHYRIHLYDNPKQASSALSAAAACGLTAPGIAHMWHMPGHTYTKLLRYADATWGQEASARVDHAYMMRDGIMPYEIHNYAHNNEWLVRNLLFVGRVTDAIELAKNMIELPRHPKFNESSNRGSGAGYGRARLIDALSQHQMWDEFLALSDTYLLDEEADTDQQIRWLRYNGVARAIKGEQKEAESFIVRLQKLKESIFEKAATAPASTAPAVVEADAEEESHPEAPPPPAKTDQKTLTRQGVAVENATNQIYSAIATHNKDFATAAESLKAANGRWEHLALAYLAAGNTAKAGEYAAKAANAGKNQTYPLAVQVLVSHGTGQAQEAKKQFEALREIAADVDVTVEPYKSVAALAPAFGVTGEWRKPRVVPGDIRERPEFDSLGPFRWRPSPAADFSGLTADGSPLALSNYSGKPVVVIFFLGHSCLHCILQLEAFAPMAAEYEAAGISVVAISTDDQPSLNQAWEMAQIDGLKVPFPLLADPAMEIFKRYHCWDDFENAPIHGTFLIDGKGLVRWQDISADPFMEPEFLLRESKRLLTVEP